MRSTKRGGVFPSFLLHSGNVPTQLNVALECVSKEFSVSIEDIESPKKNRLVASARMAYYLISKRNTRATDEQIGARVNRVPSTVNRGIDSVLCDVMTDTKYRSKIEYAEKVYIERVDTEVNSSGLRRDLAKDELISIQGDLYEDRDFNRSDILAISRRIKKVIDIL